MRLDKYAADLKTVVGSLKAVTRFDMAESELKQFLAFIDYVNNTLDEYSSQIGDSHNLDTFMVPTELKGLFYPARIVDDPAREHLCVNLLVKEDITDSEIVNEDGKLTYTYNDFVDTVSKLYGTMRKNPDFALSLRDIRKIDQLSNHTARQMSDGYCQITSDTGVLPVELSVSVYKSHVFSLPEKQYVTDMFRSIFRTIKG